jgi:KipI family sensor histidine kinase inhibitor
MQRPVHLRPFGATAALAEVGDAATALALATWARASGVAAVEVVPAAETVLFDGVDDLAALAAQLVSWSPANALPPGDLVELPVVYDGPDLEFLAGVWGTDVAGVVRRHREVEYVASFCGFAPGFAYLAGLPTDLGVPRLQSPRAQVPAGSVGLADRWCGVYPSASPGGWRLIGRTDVRLWDPAGDPPALLAPGTRVRFREAT